MMKGTKKMKQTWLMIALILSLLLTACGGGGNSAAPEQGGSAEAEAGPAGGAESSNASGGTVPVGEANNTFQIKEYMLYGTHEYMAENPEMSEEEGIEEFLSGMKFERREKEPGKYKPDDIGYDIFTPNASIVPIRINAGRLLDSYRTVLNQYNGNDSDLRDLSINESWQKLYSNIVKENPENAEEIFSRIKNLYDTSVIKMSFLDDEGGWINGGWSFTYVIDNNVMKCRMISGVDEDLTISYYEPEIEEEYLVGFKDDSLVLEREGVCVTLLNFERAFERRNPDMDNEYRIHGAAADDESMYEDIVGIQVSWDFGTTYTDKNVYVVFKDGSMDVDAKAERIEPNKVVLTWDEKWTPEGGTIKDPGQISFRYLNALDLVYSESLTPGFTLIDDAGNTYPYMASSDAYFKNKMGDNLAEGTNPENLDDEAKGKLVGDQTYVVSKIEDAFQAAGENVEVDKDNGTVRFDTNILFASDSAELSEEGIEDLNRFLEVYVPVMKEQVQEGRVATISIDGHTDTRASYEHNQKLSEERAQAVAAYVIEADPELEEYITTKGFSYDKPIFAEDGSVDMDASRRVEFRFILKAE